MGARFPIQALTVAITAPIALAACSSLQGTSGSAEPATPAGAVENYTDIAHATYQDALISARALDEATDAFIAHPGEQTLAAARQAWLASRVPYQQSEVFRFGNAIVDDWEGQLNAWPLDEGLIDYVDTSDYQHELGNAGATVNIIASQSITIGGETIDVSSLTSGLLADLNEIGGSEANVATGYHAIEFLLWGQDLHGFDAGNGERPYTDYVQGEGCSHGHCDRRAAYLDAITDLLVSDLEWMTAQWAPGSSDNYRAELLAMEPSAAIQKMLFGMGSLSLGELAGERMKVALEANSYEDEHDCFSDNTHNSHYYDAKGIQNVYLGRYTRIDGRTVSGPSLSDLVAQQDPALDSQLRNELAATMDAVQTLKDAAENQDHPMPFDMMIAPGNARGAELVSTAITALVTQTGEIEKASETLGIQSMKPDDAGHTF
ncbi:peptidase [Marinobacter halodurans]|uniref:Peptidase n=1 Tax=Marinobacter halodurans TaxID=2528979 RepID=A0ABY1ZI75_9GAMM|nr:imelysin family protein [Marinobacter halodurans]TBW54312.1 peptidase [Marinobacter halodurans]